MLEAVCMVFKRRGHDALLSKACSENQGRKTVWVVKSGMAQSGVVVTVLLRLPWMCVHHTKWFSRYSPVWCGLEWGHWTTKRIGENCKKMIFGRLVFDKNIKKSNGLKREMA
mmetsp:Transcript_21781/g.49548  ORF Transcript_21781/g.49548 Transcript_21781/m.49548 type:complete len:112 (-) Transcript_21781:246-581(-)